MNQRHIPRPGEFYRHFKGELYQIITVAKHSETEERMVVYQALYGIYETYVRPLSMFVSEVDDEQCPLAGQIYRFELVKLGEETSPIIDFGIEEISKDEQGSNAAIMLFLEAENYKDKLEVLYSVRKEKTDGMLDTMAISLDLQLTNCSLEEKWEALRKHLETLCKYDGRRLR